MKVVIVGNGKVGLEVTQGLSNENHDVILIDNNMEHLKSVIDKLDVLCYCGNGASYTVQKEAGVEGADLLVAATSLDEINLICCLVARKLNVKHTIARIRNPEYTEQIKVLRDELGVSLSINPEKETALDIARGLRFPGAIKLDSFARGKVELVEIKICDNNPLANRNLSEINKLVKSRVLICAVRRGNEVFIPSGDFTFKIGDKVTFTASPSVINAFFKEVGIQRSKIHNVMIIGGGKISFYLAQQLLKLGMDVKIIENRYERCQYLNEMFPKASVICGDGTDYGLLLEEGLEVADAVISLTGIDEMNIMISMFAQSHSVRKTVTKINRVNYTEILTQTGLDSVVSPKEITAQRIIQYVRAMQNSHGNSNVETMHRIVNNQVEALEFIIKKPDFYVGVPFKDLHFKRNVLIASIVRNGRHIMPYGNDMIQLKDRIVAVTTMENVDDLKDLFE